MQITPALAARLISSQFPQYAHLPISPSPSSGHDNRTFRLGSHLLIRLPSAPEYASQPEKEATWLPKLAPHLPLAIPKPVALGKPSSDYPWHFSIYTWLPGNPATSTPPSDPILFAKTLAHFIHTLHKIDPKGAPPPGPHSFYRGGSLKTYSEEVLRALPILEGKIDTAAALTLWQNALATTWENPPVFVHGDLAASNLLIEKGRLTGVLDFGQLTVGDPACDLAIAWTFLDRANRPHFFAPLNLSEETLLRGRAWALWKALIITSGLSKTSPAEEALQARALQEVLSLSD